MQVRIFQPTKSAMQSPKNSQKWCLEFVKKSGSRFYESVIGRTSSADMSNEIKLVFNTLEEAKFFAEKQSYQYEVVEPEQVIIQKKSYASNFC